MKKTIFLSMLSLLMAFPLGAQTTEIEKAFRKIEALGGFIPMTGEQLNDLNEGFLSQGGVAKGLLQGGVEPSDELLEVLNGFSSDVDCTSMTTAEGDYLCLFLEQEPADPSRGHLLLAMLAQEGTMVAHLSRAQMSAYRVFAAQTILDQCLQTMPVKTTYLEDTFTAMTKIAGSEVFPPEANEEGTGWFDSLVIEGEEALDAVSPMLDALPTTVSYTQVLSSDGLYLVFVEPGTTEAAAHALIVLYLIDEEGIGIYSQLYYDTTIDDALLLAVGLLTSGIVEEVEVE